VTHVSNHKSKQELEQEVELLDTMLSSLVDVLEQKGILTHAEWEKQIKKQVKI
jgi:hypothetical protein